MTREQFTASVDGCQRALRRFLTALCCGDSFMADDLAQEAFIKAYVHLDTLEDPGKFKSWIFRIAYTTFLSHKRSVRPMADIEETRNIAGEDDADSAFRYQKLYIALDKLQEKERMAVLLFYLENYSVKEIAEITESGQDAVRQRLSRGRQHLKEFLTIND